MKQRRFGISGFSILELAIVVTIIGLVVTGVLNYSSLIKSSKVNAQIAQINKFNAAVVSFKMAYGGLPGDISLAKASKFSNLTTSTGAANHGDGNDQITGDLRTTSQEAETSAFWLHLAQSGLADGAPSKGGYKDYFDTLTATDLLMTNAFPKAKFTDDSFVMVMYDSITTNSHFFFVTSVPSNVWDARPSYGRAILPIDAYNIDIKIDDGHPTQGKVQATAHSQIVANRTNYDGMIDAAYGPGNCYENTNFTYINLDSNELSCNLKFFLPE